MKKKPDTEVATGSGKILIAVLLFIYYWGSK